MGRRTMTAAMILTVLVMSSILPASAKANVKAGQGSAVSAQAAAAAQETYTDCVLSGMDSARSLKEAQQAATMVIQGTYARGEGNSEYAIYVDSKTADLGAASAKEDVSTAALNVYRGVSVSVNKGLPVVFDPYELQILENNWVVLSSSGDLQYPIEVEEYESMRAGRMVKYEYDEGVEVIWGKDLNNVSVSQHNCYQEE